MNLTEMRALLTEHGIQLTKSLGQNFLHDGNQLRRIAGAGEIKTGDKILEIGPGLGPLTELLLENGNEVLAMKKTAALFHYWKNASPSERTLPCLTTTLCAWWKIKRAIGRNGNSSPTCPTPSLLRS